MAKKKTILKSQEETELILKEKTISFGLEVRGLTVIHCLYKLANIHRFSMCDFCTVIKTQTLFHTMGHGFQLTYFTQTTFIDFTSETKFIIKSKIFLILPLSISHACLTLWTGHLFLGPFS